MAKWTVKSNGSFLESDWGVTSAKPVFVPSNSMAIVIYKKR